MNDIEVFGLSKSYTSFKLNNVSFSIKQGSITGFIGRNGAGKSTALSCILNFVHPDSGEVRFFGKNFSDNELEIKSQIGFVSGGTDFYPQKKLKQITKITKSFYSNWSENDYKNYINLFELDESKMPKDLSNGMKIKYSLALAMSHNAKLLILDEPTSGLDPVSRDELLDVFMSLNDKGITILFSTHITSDLEKCADDIIYIKNGYIKANMPLNDFVNQYVLVNEDNIDVNLIDKVSCGERKSKSGSTFLVKCEDAKKYSLKFEICNIDDIIVHLEKEMTI